MSSEKLILVTGGAGYIGSHTVIELIQDGHDVIIVDNLCNSSFESIRRIEDITGKKLKFHHISICDRVSMENVFSIYKNRMWAVIHFAGLKSVNESISNPILYYSNNVTGSLILFEIMEKHKINRLVFSSSATVYGEPKVLPIPEEHDFNPTNAYGRSKLMIEEIINDLCKKKFTDFPFKAIILRYFNPIGAHESGLIGDDPQGIPNNLMPYVSQVLIGKLDHLNIYGNDYSTLDGTGVRDFIHVVDLAKGHLAALNHFKKMDEQNEDTCLAYNMGTGTGYSVLQIVETMEFITNSKIPRIFTNRRPGDIDKVVADASKAYQELGWKAKYNLNDMCLSNWKWQLINPNGYSSQ